MDKKSAIQQMKEARNHLEIARDCLHNALETVEKDRNKQRIEGNLEAVEKAIQRSTASMLKYQD